MDRWANDDPSNDLDVAIDYSSSFVLYILARLVAAVSGVVEWKNSSRLPMP
jgi:hypothetical protein